jgi:alkaline phosphatase D
MKKIILIIVISLFFSCNEKFKESESKQQNEITTDSIHDIFTMVFVSCSDQDMEQPLWSPILNHNPDVFIWGGDNVYADTNDMDKMRADYQKVLDHPEYAQLNSNSLVIGTWDDHDYGKNDAGKEWEMKDEAQQVLLDFLGIPKDDTIRDQKGVYQSHRFTNLSGSIKVILLDTRYFRDELKKSTDVNKRYDPWDEEHDGTILGDTQWKWLTEELKDDRNDFTLIVSSIQFLAHEHGWEKWGNFPNEVAKMEDVIKNAKARNIIILSGDRHLAEFSKTEIDGLEYPLIDFTSSGMTKTYPNSPFEPNRYRVGDQVRQLNFGVLKFNFQKRKVRFEIRGENNKLYYFIEQKY